MVALASEPVAVLAASSPGTRELLASAAVLASPREFVDSARLCASWRSRRALAAAFSSFSRLLRAIASATTLSRIFSAFFAALRVRLTLVGE